MPGKKQIKPEMSEARQAGYFNIGEASLASGVSAKMIRHYEETGLIPPARRTFANYRIYSESDVHTLVFIKRARSLGFPMKKITTLLSLYRDKSRTSAEVKQLAQEHIKELEDTMHKLQDMSDTLKKLVHHCHGDVRPECPILEGLSAQVNRRFDQI